MENQVKKKVVIITGALGGIGSSICQVFSERGWKVIGMDVRIASEAPHCDEVVSRDLHKICIDEAYRKDSFAELDKHVEGNLHCLVNNAAIQLLGNTEELALSDWQETMNVNLTGPMLLSQHYVGQLAENNGPIVNIASIHQQLTKPRFVSYATSKSALVGLTKAMAVDLQGKVRINCISPAAIETDMLRAGFDNDESALTALKKLHPSQRIGYPVEVAKLVYFLTTGEAQFINGANLQLDGGISSVLHDL